MMTPPPPEFALVAACCRWPRSDEALAKIKAAATGEIDWPRVERIARRHRVAALVYDGVITAKLDFPKTSRDRLLSSARSAGVVSLRQARETLHLQQAFDKAKIPACFVKGTTLAQLAYGKLGVKESWDIDLLTTEGDAAAARQLIEDLGYRLKLPPDLDEKGFARLVRVARECVFHNEARGIWLELHWRLIDNPQLLHGITAAVPARLIPLAGGVVRTLKDEPLFAFLCLHGTIHAWFRLKWLTDVAAFLSGKGGEEIERLYGAAIALGAARAPGVALLLCSELLALPVPLPLLDKVRSDWMTVALAANSRASLTYGGGEREFARYSLLGLKMRLSPAILAPGLLYFLSEARRQWTSPTDRIQIELPDSLGFVYHLLRIPLWLARRVRSAISGAS